MSLDAVKSELYEYRLLSYRTFNTVMGIMMNPAHVLANAPVARFAVLLNLGSELECSDPFMMASLLPAANRLALRRSAFKPEKYIAEPKPVRSVLGNVPLQNCRIGLGPFAIDLIVPKSVLERDC